MISNYALIMNFGIDTDHGENNKKTPMLAGGLCEIKIKVI